MNLSSTPLVPPEVMARKVGDETVILDLASGNYFGLDSVGARIWQLISEGRNLEVVCEVLLNEYDVARDVAEQDVLQLVQELLGRGLLVKPKPD